MTAKKVYTVPYRRKRESKTDYRRRLQLLKSGQNRLVVRKSNKHMSAQLIAYADEGDKVVASAHSRHLASYGWDLGTANIPAAYLVGYLLASRSKAKEAIVDLGLQTPKRGSRIYAVLKGAKDGGMQINLPEDVAPGEDRIKGTHISKAQEAIQDKVQFSTYKGKDVEKTFENVKQKITEKHK